ncbi:hypothetical protein ACOMHN_058983 [Nucella lapillus]
MKRAHFVVKRTPAGRNSRPSRPSISRRLSREERYEARISKLLLHLARGIFEEQTNLEKLVQKIMLDAQDLLKCEKCCVYLLEDTCERDAWTVILLASHKEQSEQVFVPIFSHPNSSHPNSSHPNSSHPNFQSPPTPVTPTSSHPNFQSPQLPVTPTSSHPNFQSPQHQSPQLQSA